MSDSMLMKLSGLDLACHMSRSVVTNVTPDSPEAVGVAAAGGDGPHLVLALRQLSPPPLLLFLLVLVRETVIKECRLRQYFMVMAFIKRVITSCS